MHMYDVVVERTKVEYITLTVEAEDEDDAHDAAKALAEINEDQKGRAIEKSWELDNETLEVTDTTQLDFSEE